MIDPLVIHEFRDRAASLRDLVDLWFDHPALDGMAVHLAIAKLQAQIEKLEPVTVSPPLTAPAEQRLTDHFQGLACKEPAAYLALRKIAKLLDERTPAQTKPAPSTPEAISAKMPWPHYHFYGMPVMAGDAEQETGAEPSSPFKRFIDALHDGSLTPDQAQQRLERECDERDERRRAEEDAQIEAMIVRVCTRILNSRAGAQA